MHCNEKGLGGNRDRDKKSNRTILSIWVETKNLLKIIRSDRLNFQTWFIHYRLFHFFLLGF